MYVYVLDIIFKWEVIFICYICISIKFNTIKKKNLQQFKNFLKFHTSAHLASIPLHNKPEA